MDDDRLASAINEAYIREMAGSPPSEDDLVKAILDVNPTIAALEIFEMDRRASSAELVARAERDVADTPEVWGGVLMDEPERMGQLDRVLNRVRQGI